MIDVANPLGPGQIFLFPVIPFTPSLISKSLSPSFELMLASEIAFGMSRKKAEGSMQTTETAAEVASNRPNISTDYIATFDEAAKQRLYNINQKLKSLERQMEVLEVELNKANDFERIVLETP